MRVRNHRLHWSLRLGQFAFGLILIGASILGTVFMQQSRSYLDTTLQRLAPLSRSELLQAKADAESMIEGRISPANEVLAHGMVALERARAVADIRGDTVWIAESRQTPSIVVDLVDGPIQVLGDYQMVGNLQTHVEAAARYTGLAAGTTVVVIGKAMQGSGVARIDASLVIPGNRTELLKSRIHYWELGVGAGLMALGLGIMVWLLRQGYSPFGNRNTGVH